MSKLPGRGMAEDGLKGAKNQLEQFLLLAKNAKGVAAAHLIKQVTEAPGVYVFGELMTLPNILETKTGEFEKEWKLLNLFAYGKYKDFMDSPESFPELNQLQVTKLRHLTIIELAALSKHIQYSTLLDELGMRSVRELEDLIIEAIYAGIVRGKLDQKRQQLEIEFVIGRDIKAETMDSIVSVLENWCTNCEGILGSLDKQIARSNGSKEYNLKLKKQIDEETENLKKAIKAQSNEMSTEDADSSTFQTQMQTIQPKQSKITKSLKSTLQGRGR